MLGFGPLPKPGLSEIANEPGWLLVSMSLVVVWAVCGLAALCAFMVFDRWKGTSVQDIDPRAPFTNKLRTPTQKTVRPEAKMLATLVVIFFTMFAMAGFAWMAGNASFARLAIGDGYLRDVFELVSHVFFWLLLSEVATFLALSKKFLSRSGPLPCSGAGMKKSR
tara:strand:- start:225 stop:719 length:495 start_codon:yes stop_codon:yes gene_type:complete